MKHGYDDMEQHVGKEFVQKLLIYLASMIYTRKTSSVGI